MIVSLTGTLHDITSNSVVLDVNGVGYELGVSTQTLSMLPEVHTPDVSLLVRMIVREGDISLFGFLSAQERLVFDKLRAVSGVGPKLALSVLSAFTPEALVEAVGSQNLDALTKIPGVGKKMASRLLVELKTAFEKEILVSKVTITSSASLGNQSILEEVREALLAMGFSSEESELAVGAIPNDKLSTTQKALSHALKSLGGLR